MREPAAAGLPLRGLRAYILAKDEEANILRGIQALLGLGAEVTVLDSGSRDGTRDLVVQHSSAVFERYHYVDHVTAYEDVLLRRVAPEQPVAIFDADMVVPPALGQELSGLLQRVDWDVVVAPVEWRAEGSPIPRASLYPPKAILFRAGRAWMVPRGHGEALARGTRVLMTRSRLIHDDRKGLVAFLSSQVRYAQQMLARERAGALGWRDWVRTHTPLMLVAVPAYILLAKRGLGDGLPGLIYALDRLAAETIFLRESLASRLRVRRGEAPGSAGEQAARPRRE